MRLRDLKLFFLIALFLVVGELSLEVRAHRRGFDSIMGSLLTGTGQTTAESDESPFHGPLPEQVRPPGALRIWFSSSSYAQDDRYPPGDTFPFLVGEMLQGRVDSDVEVINASQAGYSLRENALDLSEHGRTWRPDYVLIYQLSNDLNGLSGPGAVAAEERPRTEPEADAFATARRLYESTTVFAQLRANFTPFFTERLLLPMEPPEGASGAFQRRLMAVVDAARQVGATPVLVTFATSHRAGDVVPRDRRFWMLRWNPHLLPDGYLATIDRWNEVIRRTAASEGLPLIDLADGLTGRPELFRDLAHFVPEGHRVVADLLAQGMSAAVPTGGPGE